jgi:hypothetical protein
VFSVYRGTFTFNTVLLRHTALLILGVKIIAKDGTKNESKQLKNSTLYCTNGSKSGIMTREIVAG